MAKRLNVYTVGLNCIWCDKEANIAQVEDALSKMPANTDLVVLPEMFSTGFITDDTALIKSLSERNTGESMNRIKELAGKYNVALSGSFLAYTAPKFYNRAFFIEPSGEETYYDKRHLFSPGAEATNYTPGDKLPPVIRFRGWNIMPIVCYDLRFPAWCRNLNMKYDLLIVVANWPKVREYAWSQLLIARAIENQAFVCGVNRSGIGPAELEFPDNSSHIINYKGEFIETVVSPTSLWASLDGDALDKFTAKFPVWKDADTYCL